MRAIFGVVILIVVVAIVGVVAKQQLKAVDGGIASRTRSATDQAARAAADASPRGAGDRPAPGGFAGAAAADPNATAVPQVSKNLQQQARDRTTQALQQGMQRTERAAP